MTAMTLGALISMGVSFGMNGASFDSFALNSKLIGKLITAVASAVEKNKPQVELPLIQSAPLTEAPVVG